MKLTIHSNGDKTYNAPRKDGEHQKGIYVCGMCEKQWDFRVLYIHHDCEVWNK